MARLLREAGAPYAQQAQSSAFRSALRRQQSSGRRMLELLRTLLLENLDVVFETDAIDGETPLFEGGLGLDSFAVVELISLIERRFGIEFTDDDLRPEYFANLGILADFIARKAGPQAVDGSSALP